MAFFAFALLAEYVDETFLWLALGLPLFAGVYTTLLRCPRCRTPIEKQRARIAGVEILAWGATGIRVPKHCSGCRAEIP